MRPMNEPLHEQIQIGTRGVQSGHEPLLERIEVLERTVLRWKLISLVLLLLLLSGTAISGTFGAILLFAERGGMRVHEAELRQMEMIDREQQARVEAERAREQAELARQRLEQLQQKGQANQPEPVDP
jgi:hypothetical protein